MEIKVVIYARVSTKVQEYDRQLEELRSYANRMGYNVMREFAETVSGAKKIEERAALTELMDYVETHEVNKVLVYEPSRLSRRVVDFLKVIEFFTERKVSVYIHQNGLETLLPDNRPNPVSQLALGLFASFNSLEKTMIRSRMESGYNHFRENGGKVGRKTGYRKHLDDYKKQYSREIALIKKHVSYRNIAAITGTSVSTITFLKQNIVAEDKKM